MEVAAQSPLLGVLPFGSRLSSSRLLVESIAGPDLTQAAYEAAALGHGYLWHGFGDSALLLPSR